jgi:pSer/pThr/pTyr-binding forkhead associated (FHA) protein
MMSALKRYRIENNIYIASVLASVLTILAIKWLFHHMDITDSGFDYYPSRWINSIPFYILVFTGSISGGLFFGSLLPWKIIRLIFMLILGIGVPILFLLTIYSYFEGYGWTEHSLWEDVIVTISQTGVGIVILGWLLSLVSLPIYLLVKLLGKTSQGHKRKGSSNPNVFKDNIQPVPIYGPPSSFLQNEIIIPGSLVIFSGSEKDKLIKLKGVSESGGILVTIGRKEISGSQAENAERDRHLHIQIKDPAISRFQAKMFYRNGVLSVKNLSKTNKTKLNETIIPDNQWVEIEDGSKITIGNTELIYRI